MMSVLQVYYTFYTRAKRMCSLHVPTLMDDIPKIVPIERGRLKNLLLASQLSSNCTTIDYTAYTIMHMIACIVEHVQ